MGTHFAYWTSAAVDKLEVRPTLKWSVRSPRSDICIRPIIIIILNSIDPYIVFTTRYIDFESQYRPIEFTTEYIEFATRYIDFESRYIEFTTQYIEITTRYIDI